ERGANLGKLVFEPPLDQVDRRALQLALPRLVDVEDVLWAGAERAVIEVDDVGIEQERVALAHPSESASSLPVSPFIPSSRAETLAADTSEVARSRSPGSSRASSMCA